MADPDFFRDDNISTTVKPESKPFQEHDMDKEVDLFAEPETEVDKSVFGKKLEKVIKEEEPVEKPVKAPTKAELKRIAALYGEEKYEVPLEAKIKHKVDNTEAELTIQELLNNYSGKTAWDKKFTELGTEKKKYQEELELVNKYVNDFAEASKKDKVAGLVSLAQSVGLDPLEYKKQLRSELLSQYGSYLSMNDAERQLFDQQEELSYYKSLRESELSKQKMAQAEYARQNQFKNVQETHGIDNDRFAYLQSELKNTYQLDVTPENVLELHAATSRLDRVDNALKSINPAFLDDLEKVTELEGLLRSNPNLTDKQLSEKAKKLYGNEIEKAIANLAQKLPEKVGKQKEKDHSFTPKLKATGNSINFFD